MKINKNDVDKVLKKSEMPVRKEKITDMPKYMYWHQRSSDYIDAMNNSKYGSDEYLENLHQGLLCEFEKNRYCHITKREFILLYTLVKFHNAKNKKNKLYFNDKGRRAKPHDRNVIRTGEE